MKNICSRILFCLMLTYSSVSGQQVIEDVGHGIQIGLPITALGVSLLQKDKKGAVQLLKSFVLESVVVTGLKRTVKRRRPNGGRYSFPSGHTALAFMSSTYLWKRYGWEYGVPATLLAGFVGYSRAGTDEPVHYYSDVFAGAGIGILSSWIFTKNRDKEVSVTLMGDTTYLGVQLQWEIR